MGDSEERSSESQLQRIYGQLQLIHEALSAITNQMTVTQMRQAQCDLDTKRLEAQISNLVVATDKYKSDRSFILGIAFALAAAQACGAYVATSWLDGVNSRFIQMSAMQHELSAEIRKVQDEHLRKQK